MQVTEGMRGRAFFGVTQSRCSPRPPTGCPAVPVCASGGCRGCDWQHASIAAQRRLKAAVVVEQMRRLGGVDVGDEVERCPVVDGLGWRTHFVQYAVDADGNLGFRRHRSHDIVPVDVCLIAHPLVRDCGATAHTWVDREAVEVVTSPEP